LVVGNGMNLVDGRCGTTECGITLSDGLFGTGTMIDDGTFGGITLVTTIIGEFHDHGIGTVVLVGSGGTVEIGIITLDGTLDGRSGVGTMIPWCDGKTITHFEVGAY